MKANLWALDSAIQKCTQPRDPLFISFLQSRNEHKFSDSPSCAYGSFSSYSPLTGLNESRISIKEWRKICNAGRQCQMLNSNWHSKEFSIMTFFLWSTWKKKLHQNKLFKSVWFSVCKTGILTHANMFFNNLRVGTSQTEQLFSIASKSKTVHFIIFPKKSSN